MHATWPASNGRDTLANDLYNRYRSVHSPMPHTRRHVSRLSASGGPVTPHSERHEKTTAAIER
jgi:hypothetical protein